MSGVHLYRHLFCRFCRCARGGTLGGHEAREIRRSHGSGGRLMGLPDGATPGR